MGPTGVPLMGELRKTYSHSPLEILPGLYTAKWLEGQLEVWNINVFLR
jgi:hypothetical protein